MVFSVSSRLVPLGILFALHGAAFGLAVETLSRNPEAASAPTCLGWWPRVFWWAVCCRSGRPGGPGDSGSGPLGLFRSTCPFAAGILDDVQAFGDGAGAGPDGVVASPAGGTGSGFGRAGVFFGGAGEPDGLGTSIPSATQETLWGLGALGVVLVGGAFALRSALIQKEKVEAELVHLNWASSRLSRRTSGSRELAAAVGANLHAPGAASDHREIHDIVGYTLTNQTMVLQAAAVLLDRDHEKLRGIAGVGRGVGPVGPSGSAAGASSAAGRCRTAPGLLEPLAAAVPYLRTGDLGQGGTVWSPNSDNLPPSLELVLYRMIQEGLTNAFLHGKASRVSVGLVLGDDGLTVHLADNGTGAEQVTEGHRLDRHARTPGSVRREFDYRGGAHGFTVWAKIPRVALQEEP